MAGRINVTIACALLSQQKRPDYRNSVAELLARVFAGGLHASLAEPKSVERSGF